MVITKDELSADTGEVYDALDGGTTAADSLILRAEEYVKLKSGTTAGYDAVIRPLAAAMAVTQVKGGVDSVNKTIGSLSVGNKDLNSMRKDFWEEARRAAIMKGISLDGLSIIMRDSAN